MPYVYRHIRLDKNEPFYIGISSTDDNYARAFDRSHKHRRNKLWQNIANKTDFEVEILLDNLTHEESCEKEMEFIKMLKQSKDDKQKHNTQRHSNTYIS